MRLVVALPIALVALVGARLVHGSAANLRGAETADPPYAPSPTAAPFVTLGYREVGADLFWLRMTGYLGDSESTADGIAALVETITTLDPKFHRAYEWGARAMTLGVGVDRAIYLRAIALLDRGGREFPDDWHLPSLEGQIYTQDLVTDDPVLRRVWDERGTLLVESALRKPNAPAEAANWAATMWSKLGQRQHAIEGLREMLLLTEDEHARRSIVARLAELEHADATLLSIELADAKARTTAAWNRERPALPFTMYVLLGPHLSPRFDLTDLATGGIDLAPARIEVEPLPPVE